MKLIFSLTLMTALVSCHFPVRVLSDAQISKHYADKTTRPDFKYLKYKRFRIHHAVSGDSSKPLLLIVHGAPGAWYSSMKLLDDSALQKNFHIVSFDRLGFGKSNYGVSEPSIQTHVNCLEKIVRQYNRDGKIYLLGSSYGAPIAASFAMQHPEMVRNLYLVSPVIDPAHEKMFWFSYVGKFGLISMLIPEYLNVTGDEKFAHRSQLRKLRSHWQNITCKTYVIMGEKDHLASLKNLEFAKKKLVNADTPEFYLMPGTGHTIVHQHPETIISLLLGQKDSLLAH